MDDARFDRLVRLFSIPRSRRATLASLLGGVIGIRVLGVEAGKKRRHAKRGKSKRNKGKQQGAGHPAAEAKNCRTQGHPCEGNQSCCAPFVCVVSGPGNADRCTPCPSGTVYFKGACCTPTTCAAEGAECGQINDTCGGTLDCGECSGHDTCGGGGEPYVCGCTPPTCPPGANCGTIPNPCGDPIQCGPSTCTQPGSPCQEAVCHDNVCTTRNRDDGVVCEAGPAGNPCLDKVCDNGNCDKRCAGCNFCANLAGGGTACVTLGASSTCPAGGCSSQADCSADHPCVTSFVTVVTGEIEDWNLCAPEPGTCTLLDECV